MLKLIMGMMDNTNNNSIPLLNQSTNNELSKTRFSPAPANNQTKEQGMPKTI